MPNDPKGPKRKTEATKLRFVGNPDQYVSGVPRADLDIVETPTTETQVTPARARELVATRLFAPAEGELPRAENEEAAPAATEEV